MSDRSVIEPGPDHPITVTPAGQRVVVRVAGQVVADSSAALRLQESTYPPVLYLPLADVDPGLIEATDHHTYCPYKGEASYFSIPAGGPRSENAIWSYRTPHPAVAEIKDHVAFYPDRVDEISVG
jgi:uncharacterized protein (DUF427 family)